MTVWLVGILFGIAPLQEIPNSPFQLKVILTAPIGTVVQTGMLWQRMVW